MTCTIEDELEGKGVGEEALEVKIALGELFNINPLYNNPGKR